MSGTLSGTASRDDGEIVLHPPCRLALQDGQFWILFRRNEPLGFFVARLSVHSHNQATRRERTLDSALGDRERLWPPRRERSHLVGVADGAVNERLDIWCAALSNDSNSGRVVSMSAASSTSIVGWNFSTTRKTTASVRLDPSNGFGTSFPTMLWLIVLPHSGTGDQNARIGAMPNASTACANTTHRRFNDNGLGLDRDNETLERRGDLIEQCDAVDRQIPRLDALETWRKVVDIF